MVLLLILGAARWLTGLFSKRTHAYRATATRQLRLLFWPLLALGAGLSVVPAVIMGRPETSHFEWLLTTGFVFFTLILSGPALVSKVRLDPPVIVKVVPAAAARVAPPVRVSASPMVKVVVASSEAFDRDTAPVPKAAPSPIETLPAVIVVPPT